MGRGCYPSQTTRGKKKLSSDNTAEVKSFCLCIWRCNIQAVTVKATRRGGRNRGRRVREEEIKERRAFSTASEVFFFFFPLI